MSIENIPNVVTAACILHNVCEIHGESFNEAWLHEIQGSELQQPNPGSVRDSNGDRPKHIRDVLVSYFHSTDLWQLCYELVLLIVLFASYRLT